MVRIAKHSVILLYSLAALGCGQAEPELPEYDFSTLQFTRPLLSELEANETVVIEVISTGCFDFYSAHRYEIAGPVPLAVHGYEGNREEPISWASVGRFRMAEAEVHRLDRLIAFYRTDVEDVWCTSKDRVTLRWTTENAVRLEEQFLDDTCMADESPEVLPIWEMAGLAETGDMKPN